jgi:hypothetical protein
MCVQYIIIEQNIQTTRTKYLYVPKNYMNCQNKYVYVSNKFYNYQNEVRTKLCEQSEQICIHVEQILQTIRTKDCTYRTNLYELPE